jgi:hypothetical protein
VRCGHTLPNGTQCEQPANGAALAYGVEEVGVHYGLINVSLRSVDYPAFDVQCEVAANPMTVWPVACLIASYSAKRHYSSMCYSYG